MTIIARYERCKVCHKLYSKNPDVGVFDCPYCHGLQGTKAIWKRGTGKMKGENKRKRN